MREQPARVLDGVRGWNVVDSSEQLRAQRLDTLLLCESSAEGSDGLGSGRGIVVPLLSSPRRNVFEPVAESERRDAVVAVVSLDGRAHVSRDRVHVADCERVLEGAQPAARGVQLDLRDESRTAARDS